MAFNNANNFVVHGNINAVDNSRRVDSGSFKDLVNAACPGASHQSAERADPPRCHPATRKKIIEEIMGWIDSPDTEKSIMWFNGSAGIGKSAIAQTIAERCSREGILLSSFFFSRTATGSGRDDGNKLVPTIAYHLALAVPAGRELIIAELERDPAVFQHSMEVQFKQLVMKPIEEMQGSDSEINIPHVVIIDGMDECNGTSAQAKIITTIAENVSFKAVRMKFFITSRPERDIQKAFDYPRVDHISTRLSLIADTSADGDVKAYLEDEFKKLKETHTIATDLSKSEWPTEETIWTLVYRSSGHFIYASTVMRYISNDHLDPREALQAVIFPAKDRLSGENPFAQLDALYLHILSEAASKSKGAYAMLSQIMCILLHAHDFQVGHGRFRILASHHTLSEFLNISASQLELEMVHLRSIVSTTSDIRFYHASIKDFFSEKARSREFFIESIQGHAYITQRCFDIILHVADTELLCNGDVKHFAENHAWNLSSPYWYDECTSPSHAYALSKFFFHLFQSNTTIPLLQGFRKSIEHTVTIILTTMLLKLPGQDIALSLHPPFIFDFWSEYFFSFSSKIERNDVHLCRCMSKTLETFFAQKILTERMILKNMHTFMNYIPYDSEYSQYPFLNLWAAAMMGNRAFGGLLYSNKRKVEHLLYAAVKYERTFKPEHNFFKCFINDFNDILTPLKYYLRRFNSLRSFKLFIQNQISNVGFAENGRTIKDKLEREIESILLGYISHSFNSLIYEFLKVNDEHIQISDALAVHSEVYIGTKKITYHYEEEENFWDCHCYTCKPFEIPSARDEVSTVNSRVLSDEDVNMILVTASSKIIGGYQAIMEILYCLVLTDMNYHSMTNNHTIDPSMHTTTRYVLRKIDDFAEFMGVESSELLLQLECLQTLIHVHTESEHRSDTGKSILAPKDRIRLYNRSVIEFLLDKSRSGKFAVNTTRGHAYLARCCLAIIQEIHHDYEYISPDASKLSSPFSYGNTKATEIYALENYFYHMRSSNFDQQLVDEFCQLSDHEVQRMLTVMINRMPGYNVVATLKNIFRFDFWSATFSVPISDTADGVCKRVNDALDYIMVNDALGQLCYTRWSEGLLRYEDDKRGISRNDIHFDFHCLWKAALMGNRKRGGHLYINEGRYRLSLYKEWKSKTEPAPFFALTYQHWYSTLRPVKYYLIRFKKASSFTSFMQIRYPDTELSLENSQEINFVLHKCIRMFLRNIIVGYLKHESVLEEDVYNIAEATKGSHGSTLSSEIQEALAVSSMILTRWNMPARLICSTAITLQ